MNKPEKKIKEKNQYPGLAKMRFKGNGNFTLLKIQFLDHRTKILSEIHAFFFT